MSSLDIFRQGITYFNHIQSHGLKFKIASLIIIVTHKCSHMCTYTDRQINRQTDRETDTEKENIFIYI